MKGFEADNDFGWLMIGNANNEPITIIPQLGENGDWLWLAPSLLYRLDKHIRLKGNLVWVSVNAIDHTGDDTLHFKNLYEISADFSYTISENTVFTWKAGILKPEIDDYFNGRSASEDIAFGIYVRVQISF